MNNFKEINDDIIKGWLEFREETAFCNMTPQDKKYVQKQLNKLDKNFIDYLIYWNEKYYTNGFVDGSQLVMRFLEHT